MRSRWLRHGLLALGAAAAVALVVELADPTQVVQTLGRVSPGAVLLMLPVVSGLSVCRGLAWHASLVGAGIPVSRRRAITALVAAKPLIFLPAGDLGRVPVLMRLQPQVRDGGRVAGTVAFQELGFLTLLGIAILPEAGRVPLAGAIVAGLAVVDAAIITFLAWPPAFRRAVRLLARLRLLRGSEGRVEALRGGFVELCRRPVVTRTVAYDAAGTVFAFVLMAQALAAVGAGGVGLERAAFIYALGHLLSGFSFLPGGLGATEGIVTLASVAMGISAAQGAAAAITVRVVNDVLVALVGLGVYAVVRRRVARPVRPAAATTAPTASSA